MYIFNIQFLLNSLCFLSFNFPLFLLLLPYDLLDVNSLFAHINQYDPISFYCKVIKVVELITITKIIITITIVILLLIIIIKVTKLWKSKTKIILVVIGALGMIKKGTQNFIVQIPGNHSLQEMQKNVLTSTVHILQKVLLI